MRVPLEWLSEHCDPGLPAEELAERLALTGTEVGGIQRHGVPDLRLLYDPDVEVLELLGCGGPWWGCARTARPT